MTHTAHNPDTRILIVEDNVITSQELSRQLMNLGYTRIESAFSGLEAVEKANQAHPDLVLMDIHLGEGIDGTEAAERIWNSTEVPSGVVASKNRAPPEIARRNLSSRDSNPAGASTWVAA